MFNYQSLMRAQKKLPPVPQTAIVHEVTEAGIRLIFPGDILPSQKYYQYNSNISFEPGQRVAIKKVSGTYIVEHPLTVYIPPEPTVEPVLDGLVLWYDAIDNTADGHSNSPANWYDLSGNGNHGTLYNVTWEDAAAVLNGTNAYINTGYKLPQIGDFTVEIVFLTTNTLASPIFTQMGATESLRFRCFKNTSNQIGVASAGTSSTGSALDANTKYPVSVVRSGSNLQLYLNNTLDISKTAGSIDISNDLLIGVNGNTGLGLTGFFGGKIYSFRIYNRALTEAERNHNYEYDTLRYPN